MPPLTILAILGIFVVLTAVAMAVEGLTLFAPKRTGAVKGAAQRFCLGSCRMADDSCPLTRVGMAREECPLWRFVSANLETNQRIDPFEPVGPAPRSWVSLSRSR
jgi:hypothetical protein